MKGIVKIGTEEVGMVANAASPYIYKNIFHEDFLLKLQAKEPDADLFQKMAFVMAKQADMKLDELMSLSEKDFFEWLTQYEAMDIILATDAISEIYLAQKKGDSVPKNEGE